MPRVTGYSNLFEMLQSFTKLAETLNLTHAVRELNSTRQTVRRHIDILEEARGEELFELVDRKYHLTKAGEDCLKEAQTLLARGHGWLDGTLRSPESLAHIKFESKPNYAYYLQQHSVNQLWEDGEPLLQRGLRIWADADGSLESEAMAPLLPYITAYRHSYGIWACVRVGENSAYAKWVGDRWVNSVVGCVLNNTPMGLDNPIVGAKISLLIQQAFSEVKERGGVRYDHVFTTAPSIRGGEPKPISFQRLLLGTYFPDKTFILTSLATFSHNISIQGLSENRLQECNFQDSL